MRQQTADAAIINVGKEHNAVIDTPVLSAQKKSDADAEKARRNYIF